MNRFSTEQYNGQVNTNTNTKTKSTRDLAYVQPVKQCTKKDQTQQQKQGKKN